MVCNGNKAEARAPHPGVMRGLGGTYLIGRMLGAFLFMIFTAAAVASQAGERTTHNTNGTNILELSFDELLQVDVSKVYSASKYEQTVVRAPSATSIVTADEVKKFGYRTLGEVLNGLGGFYTTYDRTYQYVGIRGFNRPGDYSTRVLLMVNGHRLNDPIYSSAQVGTEFLLDLDQIERIEVIRGPSSSIYGDNAFLGVVNVITRTGGQVNGVEVSGEYGYWDTFKGLMTYGKKWKNGVDLLLSGSYYDTDGPDRLYFPEFDDPPASDGVTRGTDEDAYYRGFASLSYHGLSAQAGIGHREKGLPTAGWGSLFGDPREEAQDETAFADVSLNHEFDHDWVLQGRIFFDHYDYLGYYPYLLETRPSFTSINKDTAIGKAWGTDWQITKEVAERHKFIAGATWRNDFQQDQSNYDVETDYYYLNSRESSWNMGLFGQAEIGVLTNLYLNLGARYDYYDAFGGEVNPRLGLIYNPSPQSAVKLLYGTAYRAPNVFERFYGGVTYVTNPNLDPEEITTYELVLEHPLPGKLRGTASLYRYEIDGLISQQLREGVLVYQNAQNVTAHGLELGVERRFEAGGLARVSYALQKAEDEAMDREISNSPRHLARAQFLWPLYRDRVYSGVELLYNSSVQSDRGDSIGDFFLVNLTLFSQRIIKGLELSASVYNVFDSHYAYPASNEYLQTEIPQDGRSFRVKLTYRF